MLMKCRNSQVLLVDFFSVKGNYFQVTGVSADLKNRFEQGFNIKKISEFEK